MTQQPYYPPQPQQAYPPMQPQFPQAPPGQYPQQAYPAPVQQYAPPPAPSAPPLAQGTLDDYYNQPSVGGGPSLSWTDKQSNQPKPIGTSYVGIVARDVTNADVQQQTDFRTQAPLFYKDGRPKFAMKVPLKVQPSQEFPEGECSWFVKGQARDELVRAMAEAGCDGSPKAGATIAVTLVQRRPSGAGMSPANIVQVQYTPAGGAVTAPQQQAQAQPEVQQQYQQPPVQQYAPAQQAQPVQQWQPQAPQQVEQQIQPAQQPVPQQAPAQYGQPMQQQQTLPPQPPAGLNPEQQAMLAQLGAQQAG